MSKRIGFSTGGWGQLEMLPRVRLQMTSSGLGLGLGWLPWWLHIWLWLRPTNPPAPELSIAERWYVCDGCDWAGRRSETLHKPNSQWSPSLCPKCMDGTDWYGPHPAVPVEHGCHECGLPVAHPIHEGMSHGD